jgi:thiol-disulfide isomerase/thioredoxin
LLLGAAVVLVAVVLVLRSDVGAPPVVRGVEAPGFDLPLLGEAGEGSLSLESLRGRVVLVNFWASWCEPCEREMPAMDRLYAALPKSEFELVAVAIDENREDVVAFQERMDLDFPIVLDPGGTVYQAYQSMGVPESLLVDRTGRIVERYVGPREWDARPYRERIEALIDPSIEPGQAPTPP